MRAKNNQLRAFSFLWFNLSVAYLFIVLILCLFLRALCILFHGYYENRIVAVLLGERHFSERFCVKENPLKTIKSLDYWPNEENKN